LIVQQSSIFRKQKKKLHNNQLEFLDKAVHAIIDKPEIGLQKKGDLSSVRVHKFKICAQQYLIAYHFVEPETVVLLALGTHGNFYRDLKRAV